MILHPGAYLTLRREAAAMTIADVAEKLVTTPRMAEHARAEWVAAIEAGTMPASFSTIVALRSTFPFDLGVIAKLEQIRLGLDLQPPRLCRACGCSHYDPCVDEHGHGCSWVALDLCSACAGSALAQPAAVAA